MVRALGSRSRGPGSSPDRGHRVVFLGKTFNFRSATLHPGVQMGTVMDQNPIQGEQKYSQWLHATETGDKHQPDGPLSSYTDAYLYTKLIHQSTVRSPLTQSYRNTYHALTCVETATPFPGSSYFFARGEERGNWERICTAGRVDVSQSLFWSLTLDRPAACLKRRLLRFTSL